MHSADSVKTAQSSPDAALGRTANGCCVGATIARGGIAHRCASCVVLLTDHITHEPRVRAGGWEETSAEARLAAIAERRSGVMSVLKREGRSYTNICG